MECIVNKWDRVLRTNRPSACPHVFHTLARSLSETASYENVQFQVLQEYVIYREMCS